MFVIEDHYVPVENGTELWMGRMGKANGPAILMIHGAIENSRIFYTEKGKGLAPFLANQGYDVFVTDLRGKGKSIPLANTGRVKAGQYELIMQDIPALVNKIGQLKTSHTPIHLMAHSWGGVLLASWYARLGAQSTQVKSFTFFASKRKIYVHHLKRWVMVDLAWTGLGSLATWIKGYLPAKNMRMGSDDEPRNFFFECNRWVYSNHWIDPRDGFNYREAFNKIDFPPVLSLTGASDHSLGNPYCVKKMLDEIGVKELKNLVLSKANGHAHDYDHINILTHPDAPQDHFQMVVNWLSEHN
jgi:predicted alpha/beta hydrolase